MLKFLWEYSSQNFSLIINLFVSDIHVLSHVYFTSSNSRENLKSDDKYKAIFLSVVIHIKYKKKGSLFTRSQLWGDVDLFQGDGHLMACALKSSCETGLPSIVK